MPRHCAFLNKCKNTNIRYTVALVRIVTVAVNVTVKVPHNVDVAPHVGISVSQSVSQSVSRPNSRPHTTVSASISRCRSDIKPSHSKHNNNSISCWTVPVYVSDSTWSLSKVRRNFVLVKDCNPNLIPLVSNSSSTVSIIATVFIRNVESISTRDHSTRAPYTTKNGHRTDPIQSLIQYQVRYYNFLNVKDCSNPISRSRKVPKNVS